MHSSGLRRSTPNYTTDLGFPNIFTEALEPKAFPDTFSVCFHRTASVSNRWHLHRSTPLNARLHSKSAAAVELCISNNSMLSNSPRDPEAFVQCLFTACATAHTRLHMQCSAATQPLNPVPHIPRQATSMTALPHLLSSLLLHNAWRGGNSPTPPRCMQYAFAHASAASCHKTNDGRSRFPMVMWWHCIRCRDCDAMARQMQHVDAVSITRDDVQRDYCETRR